MTDISTSTLMLAIAALAREKEVVTRRAERATPEVDEQEHFSEQAMDLDRALSELGGLYEVQRRQHPMFPPLDQLLKPSVD
jgi:hypothetical protein